MRNYIPVAKRKYNPAKDLDGWRQVIYYSDSKSIIRVYMKDFIIRYEQHHSYANRLPRVSFAHCLDNSGNRFGSLEKCMINAKRMGLDKPSIV